MATEENASDFEFLQEMEKSLEFKQGTLTDFEWDLRNRQWEDQKGKVFNQMAQNNIWNMLFQKHKGLESRMQIQNPDDEGFSVSSRLPMVLESTQSITIPESMAPTVKAGFLDTKAPIKSLQSSKTSRVVWKVPKLSHLELFKYLDQWDKASYGKRDRIVMDFIKKYETKEKVYDTDSVFAGGGSLIFCRFAVCLHICFLKHRKVWHYYDALGIFVKSLQSDRYAEEFLRLGGMNYIIQVVRVEESGENEKLRACQFLVNLMNSRNGHAVKQFICDTPHFLESLVDSLTMCKNKELIKSCGLIFENLCIEITPANIPLVCNFVMHALPCDFNPILQSMAFKVLQSFIRLRPSLSTKCIKPTLDNLKTNNSELLVQMSNLSLVILQTKYGHELISSLMVAAEGIQLREEFHSNFRPLSGPGQTTDEIMEKRKREKVRREEVRAKQMKLDQYMHQAGALFVLNHMMTHKMDFVDDFIAKGVFGLSLKTLGSCPHFEVQGQGVTMVKFLFMASVECAISYYMMLPPKMIILILEKPEECLRYLTSPICVLLRKLGQFAMQMWPMWEEKVVSVAKIYSDGPNIPEEIYELSQIARKVHEIQQALADLLESPVMEAYPKTLHDEFPGEQEEFREHIRDFLDSGDEENLGRYHTGRDVIMGDDRFEPFRTYLDEQDYSISEDRLDARFEAGADQPSVLMKPEEDKELDAYQMAMLAEAEKHKEPEGSPVEHKDYEEYGGEGESFSHSLDPITEAGEQ